MKLLLPFVAACSLALLACPAAAGAGDGFTVKGKGRIQSVDEVRERFVVRIARLPNPLTLAWDKDTRFQRGKEPATASALAVGQQIEIRYRLSSSGRHHATRIVILSAPAEGSDPPFSR